jgi:hypothetical protein
MGQCFIMIFVQATDKERGSSGSDVQPLLCKAVRADSITLASEASLETLDAFGQGLNNEESDWAIGKQVMKACLFCLACSQEVQAETGLDGLSC